MGHIIKSQDIEMEGRFALSVDDRQAPVSDGPGSDDRVRVVAQHADHTLIEVVCTCGQTLRIRCEHPT